MTTEELRILKNFMNIMLSKNKHLSILNKIRDIIIRCKMTSATKFKGFFLYHFYVIYTFTAY